MCKILKTIVNILNNRKSKKKIYNDGNYLSKRIQKFKYIYEITIIKKAEDQKHLRI